MAPRPNAKGDAFGDEPENGPKTKGFSFRLLLQTRYTRVFDDASVKDAESNDGFALNRVFLRGIVHPTNGSPPSCWSTSPNSPTRTRSRR